MSESFNRNWAPARLFSTHGISGTVEAENRVTSAFLATIKAVPDLWGRILASVGISDFPKIKLDNIATYYQPSVVTSKNEKVTPDGAIEITGRGNNVWSALIEVKTGRDILTVEQINKYLEVAHKENIEYVITITNTLSPVRGKHYIQDGIVIKEPVRLIHLSWAEIKAQAVIFVEHVGVEDREQKWIVAEFINYLSHQKSGAAVYNFMGQYWVETLEKLSTHTLNTSDYGVKDVVSRVLEVTQYSATQLEEQLGTDVEIVRTKEEKNSLELLHKKSLNDFVEKGVTYVEYKIPNAFSTLKLAVDFTSRKLVYSVTLPANDERSNRVKANWFYKQISSVPSELSSSLRVKINTKYKNTGPDVVFRARDIDDPSQLVIEGRETTSFKLSVSFDLGTRGNESKNSFIHSMISSLEVAYTLLLGEPFSVYVPPTPVVKKPIVPDENEDSVLKKNSLPPARPSVLPPPPQFAGGFNTAK